MTQMVSMKNMAVEIKMKTFLEYSSLDEHQNAIDEDGMLMDLSDDSDSIEDG